MGQLLITLSLLLILLLTYLIYTGKDAKGRYYLVEIPVHFPVGEHIYYHPDIKLYTDEQYKTLRKGNWRILCIGSYQECLSLFHKLI